MTASEEAEAVSTAALFAWAAFRLLPYRGLLVKYSVLVRPMGVTKALDLWVGGRQVIRQQSLQISLTHSLLVSCCYVISLQEADRLATHLSSTATSTKVHGAASSTFLLKDGVTGIVSHLGPASHVVAGTSAAGTAME